MSAIIQIFKYSEYMNMNSDLSNRIQDWLKNNCATQKQLATAAGVSQSTVSRALHGGSPIWSGQIYVLAEFLGIKVKKNDPRDSEKIMSVISEMWDGTRAGEDALVRMLKTIHSFKN